MTYVVACVINVASRSNFFPSPRAFPPFPLDFY
jgi:hypothetical protein